MLKGRKQKAINLHKNIPFNWYFRSIYIDRNFVQRFVHSRRFYEVGKVIEPINGRVLDIGSADGVFSKVILEKSDASELIGIDISEPSVRWANFHWRDEKRMKFICSDAHKLPFGARSFNAVFALEVLEHVYEPIKVLQEIKRILKKGGYVVFLVPSESLIFKLVWYFWTKYYRGRVWRDTHIHAYGEDFLLKLVKMMGFKKEIDKKIIFKTLHLIKVRKV